MNKKISSFLFIFLFFLQIYSTAQNRSNSIWYFGNGAGLDFSSGSAKPIHDGTVFTLEGCASVCDENGKLLFYTDGITVWNKFHKVMKNGECLSGNRSSTQSALIVSQPGTKNIFFLFTTDEKAGKKGLCYSVVDISGEGTIMKKNSQLLALSAEKITAVQHANGKDVWVISHQWNSNNFFVFPVSLQGVGKPIISAVGAVHAETGAGENKEAIGYLCASPDGKIIASVICYRAQNNLEIFYFDNSTGKISNPTTITLNGFPYGLCFSPDNTKLYISFLKGKSGVVQYDLNDKSVKEVAVNEKENSFGSLAEGSNGEIYVARTGKFLDVIEVPNEKGISCKYKKDAVDLSPAGSNFGLPNFWWSSPVSSVKSSANIDCSKIIEPPFSNKDKLLMTEISVCNNNYVLNAKNPGAIYKWSTAATTQQITVDTSALYRISIAKNGCVLTDSVRVVFRKDLAVFHYLPVFNPESDFLNSEFYYSIEDVTGFALKVFDGKKKHVLFETNNTNKKWNGKNPKGEIVPSGEYLWSVTYRPNCPKESKQVTQEGKVVVKRKAIKK